MNGVVLDDAAAFERVDLVVVPVCGVRVTVVTVVTVVTIIGVIAEPETVIVPTVVSADETVGRSSPLDFSICETTTQKARCSRSTQGLIIYR